MPRKLVSRSVENLHVVGVDSNVIELYGDADQDALNGTGRCVLTQLIKLIGFRFIKLILVV